MAVNVLIIQQQNTEFWHWWDAQWNDSYSLQFTPHPIKFPGTILVTLPSVHLKWSPARLFLQSIFVCTFDYWIHVHNGTWKRPTYRWAPDQF